MVGKILDKQTLSKRQGAVFMKKDMSRMLFQKKRVTNRG